MKSIIHTNTYKTMRVIAGFLLLLGAVQTFAQPVNNQIKDVTMPAPNAAALGKYGDYSVGNFTGVPDINVPIYTVQEGSLSLPISLSYHASGIKVAEMASWVGAGWSLGAGGIISRTVQSLPDDHANGYFSTATLLETKSNQAAGNSALEAQLGYEIANNGIDGEPDLFSFNVQGYSGKFYIDKNRNAQFIPKQDLKLEIDGTLQGYTLITPDGTRYIFGKALNADGLTFTTAWEKTLMQNQPNSDEYISSWYLLRIESANKKYKINLTYDNEGYSYPNNASVKYNITIGSVSASGYQQSSTTGVDAYHTSLTTYISGKKLIQITSSTDIINFVATNVRSDLNDDQGRTAYSANTAKSLDKIEIKSGDRCQQFDFAYTYFQDPNPAYVNYKFSKKLKLESVTQKSCDGVVLIPPYVFTYDGNFLAHRQSKAIDHWGFYNGASANETTISNIPPSQYTDGVITTSFGTSNRETNETEMKKGVLTDILFPTGGKTTFTYEANAVPKTVQSAPVTVFNLGNCSSPLNTACCGLVTVSNFYTTTTEDINTGKFKLQLVKPTNGSTGDLCPNNYNITAAITAYNNGVFVGSYQISLSTNPVQSNTFIEYPLTNLNLVVGVNYSFELVVNSGYATFQIYNQPWVFINRKVGGLRIKEIKTNDGISAANDILKQYDYSLPSSPSSSSGWLLRFPSYVYGTGTFNLNSEIGCIMGTATMVSFNDESVVPMYTFEGNHIGYTFVKETQSGNGYNSGNGTKLYKFNVSTNSYYTTPPFPIPPLDPSVSNGTVANLKVISTAGTTLKETSNQIFTETPTLSVGKIRKVLVLSFPPSSQMPQCGGLSAIFYTNYQIKTLPYRLSSTTESLDNVSTTTNYTYSTDATQPLFPLTTSMTDSDGKTIVTNNKYITHSDYAADPVATKLKQLNIIASPIEVTSTVAGITTNGSKTKYWFFDNTTGLPTTSATNSFPYPQEFWKYKMTWDVNGTATTGIWEKEGTILSYNTKGQPTSFTKRGWEADSEVFTWNATNNLIASRTFKNFVWQYEYRTGTRLVNKIINIDGQFTTFDYDHLQRTTSASARGGAVVTSYNYKYQDVAQSNRNWIETKTTFTSAIGGTLSNNTTFKTVRQYLDGLGRPVQNVAVANSPNIKDVISVIAYDNQGRECFKYDPFESANANGAFVPNLPAAQPFTKIEYEPSPLSRTWKVTPPNWLPTTTEYGANAANEAYDMTGNSTYPANAVNRTITTDPDGRITKTYTDKKGRKTFTANLQTNVNTWSYMIYQFDDKDRLKVAFPHRNTWQEWFYNPELDFRYFYDNNDQIIEKRIPDAAPIYMRYNNRDQLVLTQDGKQRSLSQWLATQYDAFGRPSATGFATSTTLTATAPNPTLNPTLSTTLTAMQYGTTAGVELGKPIRTYNYFGANLESFMQYDSYGRLSSAYSNNAMYPTASAISATNFSEKITTTYDLADNVLTKVRIHKPNPDITKSITITETTDYDNALRLKRVKHQVNTMAEQIVSQMDYTVKNQLQSKWMGKVGALNFLQKVDYAYNSVGFLTGINVPSPTLGITRPLSVCGPPTGVTASATNIDLADLFSLELKYENPVAANAPTGVTATPQYGGNISQATWQVLGREKQSYTFKYDHINRLTEARYADINAAGTVTASDRYSELLTYDVRGNIKTLQRYGKNNTTCSWGLIDNLTYQYDPTITAYNPTNKLYKVTDASDLTRGFKTASNGSLYTYDANGNLTADPNKNITNITYNHLNLPTLITFTINTTIRTIAFLYDAGGNKLRKTVVDNGVTQYTQDYVGGIEYRNSVLESIFHSEGRITSIGGVMKYEYAMKDHLGNTRLMFSDRNGDGLIQSSSATQSSEVTQEQHYYAFGMQMEGPWLNNTSIVDNRYQYNGKELNEDFGLNWNDYGARFYDATLGRWNAVDPMADFYQEFSPYAYVLNNPIRLIDPNGMYSADPTASKNTSVLAQDGSRVGGAGSTTSTTNKKGNVGSSNDRDFSGINSESSNNLAVCPTCPSDKKYDDFRNSKDLFTYFYETGEVSLTGGEAVITGSRINIINAIDNVGDRVDPFVGLTAKYLGNKINQKLEYHSFPKSEGFLRSLKRVNPVKTIFGTIKAAKAVKIATSLSKIGVGLNVISALNYTNDIANGETAKGVSGLFVMGATTVATILCPQCALVAIGVSAVYSLYIEDKIFGSSKE
jgi:RHS repeat-associated protein